MAQGFHVTGTLPCVALALSTTPCLGIAALARSDRERTAGRKHLPPKLRLGTLSTMCSGPQDVSNIRSRKNLGPSYRPYPEPPTPLKKHRP